MNVVNLGNYGFINSWFTVAELWEFFHLGCWNNTSLILIEFKTGGLAMSR